MVQERRQYLKFKLLRIEKNLRRSEDNKKSGKGTMFCDLILVENERNGYVFKAFLRNSTLKKAVHCLRSLTITQAFKITGRVRQLASRPCFLSS